MTNRLFVVVVAALALTGISLVGQSKPSIQGVWRVVEITVTDPNGTAGGFAKGTHTNLQPGLLIVTGKHYARLTDTGSKPRPTTAFKVSNKPTADEALAQWVPFQANAGTFEVSGNTLLARPIVAKSPAVQGDKSGTRYTLRLEGNNLWLAEVESRGIKVENPTTIKYQRVE